MKENEMSNVIDPRQTILSTKKGSQPIVLRVEYDDSMPLTAEVITTRSKKVAEYVLLSALPQELREKIVMTVKMLYGA